MEATTTENVFLENAMAAIADASRLRILQEILEKGYVRCCDVVTLTGLSQPTCSHHIKQLVDSGLVDSRKEGRYNYLTIRKENFNKLARYFEVFSHS